MSDSVFTRHARKRVRQRALSPTSVRRAASGKRRYQGKGIYRAETVGADGAATVVVYKQRGRRRVILSSWRRRRAPS
jgi:hypothetical protein